MNPLESVKRIQNINKREANLGISEDVSWHAKYKDSAYVYVGGIPFDLIEGDLLAVFVQYGEIVDVSLVRDKATGKSKGFAFIAFEDQRSTNLAVGSSIYLIADFFGTRCLSCFSDRNENVIADIAADFLMMSKGLLIRDGVLKKIEHLQGGCRRSFQINKGIQD